jgi:hypothetical protein
MQVYCFTFASQTFNLNKMEAKKIMVKSVLDSWNARIKEGNNILDNLTDEQLQKEIAPVKTEVFIY